MDLHVLECPEYDFTINTKCFPVCLCVTQNIVAAKYRTKLRAIVSNTNYFKPIILKFKMYIYNSNSKITYSFCIHGGNTPS